MKIINQGLSAECIFLIFFFLLFQENEQSESHLQWASGCGVGAYQCLGPNTLPQGLLSLHAGLLQIKMVINYDEGSCCVKGSVRYSLIHQMWPKRIAGGAK